MISIETGFDSHKYLDAQIQHIHDRMAAFDGPTIMEFGGKPFGDHHAERVLPGYEADCKATILSYLMPVGKIAMAVNARDILMPEHGRKPVGRYRGDSGLRYDDETVRLILKARTFGFTVDDVVVTITPTNLSDEDKRIFRTFDETLAFEGVRVQYQDEIFGYPSESVLAQDPNPLKAHASIREEGKHLIIFSPGGGSGKFGIVLREICHALDNQVGPNFIKFETFPVYALPADHALDLAFEAATADLRNKVVSLSSGPVATDVLTSYDKDIENFRLLYAVARRYGMNVPSPVHEMYDPTAMGVNRIVDGITRMDIIINACRLEIQRRVQRYTRDVQEGKEYQETVDSTRQILESFRRKYE